MKKIKRYRKFLQASVLIVVTLVLILPGTSVIANNIEKARDNGSITNNPIHILPIDDELPTDNGDMPLVLQILQKLMPRVYVFVVKILDWFFNLWDNKEFKSIQEAVDKANPGDTIYVPPGIYYESVVIDKPLSLVGKDKETTIIDASKSTGMGKGYGINILEGDVTISGFTIQNTLHPNSGIWIEDRTKNIEIIDNIFQSCSSYGISLSGSENILIAKNIFRGERGIHGSWSSDSATVINNVFEDCGVKFYESYNLVITDNIFKGEYGGSIVTFYSGNNVISGNEGGYIILEDTVDTKVFENKMIGRELGIVLQSGSSNCLISDNIIDGSPGRGMGIWGADNNSIVNNVITNCNRSGIQLRGKDNLIKGNHFLDNYRGIHINHMSSTHNIIIENTFEGHTRCGISFSSGINGSLIYHNNFINNDDFDVYPTGPNDDLFFDNGAEGNYWDEYTGVDENGDGIGDTPYVIGWSGYGYVDNYPLMEPRE